MSTRHSFLSTTGLIRAPSNASTLSQVDPPKYAKSSGTKSKKPSGAKTVLSRTRAGILPLGTRFIVGMAILFSLFFIFSLSCAFIGTEEDEPPFKEMLDNVAANDPGVSVNFEWKSL